METSTTSQSNKRIEEYLEKIKDIQFQIETFIDTTLEEEICGDIINADKKDDTNFAYIATRVTLDRVMEELDNAQDYIKEIYDYIK